jgi:hypothetical protein
MYPSDHYSDTYRVPRLETPDVEQYFATKFVVLKVKKKTPKVGAKVFVITEFVVTQFDCILKRNLVLYKLIGLLKSSHIAFHEIEVKSYRISFIFVYNCAVY